MAHSYTPNLELLKIDPNVEMSLSDFIRFFQTDKQTLDTNIQALYDRIEAIAAQGYTPVQPVNIASGVLTFHVENASTGYFDLPTLLARFPENTPVRITGFVISSLTTEANVESFFSTLDRLNGLDRSDNGLTQAQLNGIINMGSTEVSTSVLAAWKRRYPDITVTSTKISSELTFCNFDGSMTLHTEKVYLNQDSAWMPLGADRSDHPDGYYYVFDGWSLNANTVVDAGNGARAGNPDLLKNVTEDRVLYAAYIKHPRTGPSFTFAQKATRVTETTIAYVDYWEDYATAPFLIYNKSDGTEVTNQAISTSGNVILDRNILTIHMFPELFNGFNHAVYFAKGSSGNYNNPVYTSPVSVPLVLIDDRPSLHVETYATAAGETAVVKIVTMGRYTRVVSLVYKESGNTDEYTVTSPSVIFNVDTANNTFSIKMLSTAMLNGSGYAINVEDAEGESLRVPIPNLRTIR